ncbi:fimbrial protein [Burkholderia semiarida]|uniref:fimbrial protein n=1 Tax=Burkholderia semiarida TaxID=2843303 RepID=UPI0023DDFE08|nr:fimbrial protein [Burkholderia semiarida]MDF3089555.1 type 1 fimbrial protein [Burkholderia semiarida]MDF3103469.1 type 1 fimbrial protein [Burkholderia semiarida]
MPQLDVYVSGLAGTINVDPNAPVGTVLYEGKASDDGFYQVKCTGKMGSTTWFTTGTRVSLPGVTDVHATNVPGIGVRLRSTFSETGLANYPVTLIGSQNATEWIYRIGFWTQIIKTGDFGLGTVSGLIGGMKVNGFNQQVFYFYLKTPIVIQPRAPTCSVKTKAINVNMDTVLASQLAGVGKTSPEKKVDDIVLTCAGATQIAGTMGKTDMYITLTDVTNPGNRSSTLSLTRDSTATGVGIQILRGGNTLVSYGPDSNAPGNQNQWFVGTYSNATVSIPLKARYIATDAKVGPGTANGAATFTMSYQ